MLAFTFMFVMNTANGFFNQFLLSATQNGWGCGLVASIPGILFPFFGQNLRRFSVKKVFPIFSLACLLS